MECICGNSLRSSDAFCIVCGRAAEFKRVSASDHAPSKSKPRLALLLVVGILLIVCSLVSGVQEATNSWRLRSVGVSTFATHIPIDVRHFTSLLPVAGIAFSLLALCGLLASQLVRFTVSLAISAVALTLLGFQIAAYISAAHRNNAQNQIAQLACDYCSSPFPPVFAWGYLVVSILLVCAIALATFEARSAR